MATNNDTPPRTLRVPRGHRQRVEEGDKDIVHQLIGQGDLFLLRNPEAPEGSKVLVSIDGVMLMHKAGVASIGPYGRDKAGPKNHPGISPSFIVVNAGQLAKVMQVEKNDLFTQYLLPEVPTIEAATERLATLRASRGNAR